MSKLQALKALIGKRLIAAADEIFGAVERTIVEYEEEVSSSLHQQDHYRKLLDSVLIPQIKLKRIDSHQFTVPKSKVKVPPEQQHSEHERSPSLDKEDPEPPQVKQDVPPEQQHCEQKDPEPPGNKEEPKELWSIQEGMQQLGGAKVNKNLNCTGDRTDCFTRTSAGQKTTGLEGEDHSEPGRSPMTPSAQSHRADSGLPSQSHRADSGLSSDTLRAVSGFSLQSHRAADSGLSTQSHSGFSSQSHRAAVSGLSSQSHRAAASGLSSQSHRADCGLSSQSHRADSGLSSQSHRAAEPGFPSQSHSGLSSLSHRGVCWGGVELGHSGVSGLNAHILARRKERCLEGCGAGLAHSGNRKVLACPQESGRHVHLRRPAAPHTQDPPGRCPGAPFGSERAFACSVCEKTFNQRGNLRNHLMIHTGEKPHKCHMCTRGFAKRADLSRHIRSHLGEKPFACLLCHKRFARKENVRHHMRKIHSEVVLTTVV